MNIEEKKQQYKKVYVTHFRRKLFPNKRVETKRDCYPKWDLSTVQKEIASKTNREHKESHDSYIHPRGGVVRVKLEDFDGNIIYGFSVCDDSDAFNKHLGNELAFNNCFESEERKAKMFFKAKARVPKQYHYMLDANKEKKD